MIPQDKTWNSFTNPFTSIATKWMPMSIRELLNICEWTYIYNSTYRAAIDRVARIFFTEYEFENNPGTEPVKNFLMDNVDIKRRLIAIGKDFLNYGNSFISLYLPFKRNLICSVCNKTFFADKLEEVAFNGESFVGDCICGAKNVIFGYRDIPDKTLSKINIIRFSPKDIDIVSNKLSGSNIYYWNIPPNEKDKIRNAKGTHIINETPIEILVAAFGDKKVKFTEEEMLHIKEDTIAGMDMDWGTPYALSCFPLVFYLAILRKANEAISMDYIIPLRIISPSSNTNYQEPSFMNLGEFKSQINSILDNHKNDPISWYVSPIPLQYQVMGGEKKSLMISDDIKMTNDELLNSMGFPAELFYGSLGLQATPMALRMLENTFDLTNIYNKILKWLFDKITPYMSIPPTKVKLTPLKLSDDIERRQIVANMAAAQKISDATLLQMYGLDFKKEQEKKLDQMKVMQELDKEMQNSQRPEEPSGMASGTPSDILQTAQGMAEQLLGIPYEQRRSELDKILKSNPLLHHAITGVMQQIRNRQK